MLMSLAFTAADQDISGPIRQRDHDNLVSPIPVNLAARYRGGCQDFVGVSLIKRFDVGGQRTLSSLLAHPRSDAARSPSIPMPC